MNDEAIYFTGNIRELAHCKLCGDPMFIVFDSKLREYCWTCTQDMELKLPLKSACKGL